MALLDSRIARSSLRGDDRARTEEDGDGDAESGHEALRGHHVRAL
jgi:hypothetical protein